jgi:hypothetical protein
MSLPTFSVAPVAYWCDLAAKSSGPQVHHVLTDPPYPEHVQGDGKMFATTPGNVPVDVRAGFDPLTSFHFVRPLVALAARWSLFHCALESLGDYRNAAPELHVRSLIYQKDRAQPQLSADRPGSKCEGAALFHNPSTKKAWNNGGTHNVFYATPEPRAKLRHPTGKPLMLCMSLIEAFTLPGEIILDPFCGAGSYGLAAYALGRQYVGTDTSTEHVASALDKLRTFDAAKARAAYEAHKDKGRMVRAEPSADWYGEE